MAPRKGNQAGSWELGDKVDGETKVRRSYCVKELVTRQFSPVSPPLLSFLPSATRLSLGAISKGRAESVLLRV